MIDNMLVIDAVVHPYDLSEENQVPTYREQLDAVYAAHRMSFDHAHRAHMLTYEEFFSDISYEAIACPEFVESPVDFAIIHALPCLGFCKGYLNDPNRAGPFQRKHLNRLFSPFPRVGAAHWNHVHPAFGRDALYHQRNFIKMGGDDDFRALLLSFARYSNHYVPLGVSLGLEADAFRSR